MKKKQVLILAVAAAVCFGASTCLSLFMGSKARAPGAAAEANAPAGPAPTIAAALVGGDAKLTPDESQLDSLIREVQQKLQECRQKEQALQDRENRLELAEELLKKQTKELEDLRIGLLAPINGLKDARDQLEQSRVRIVQEEKVNIKKTAAIYEKMDPAGASKILSGMCENQQEDHVVQILHFMSERAAAKLMAEITDKGLAGRLTDKLKRIHEEG